MCQHKCIGLRTVYIRWGIIANMRQQTVQQVTIVFGDARIAGVNSQFIHEFTRRPLHRLALDQRRYSDKGHLAKSECLSQLRNGEDRIYAEPWV